MKEGQSTGKDIAVYHIYLRKIWIQTIGQRPDKELPPLTPDKIIGISHDPQEGRTCLKTRLGKPWSRITIKGAHQLQLEYIHPRSPLIEEAVEIPVYIIYPAPFEV